MDFYDDDVEFKSPCLLIESSQGDEATIFSKMDRQYFYLGHLTSQLNHHASPSRSSACHKQDMKIVSALSETGESGDNQSTTTTSNSTSNTTLNTQHQQASSSSRRGGGGGGEGDDGDDGDDRHVNNTLNEPDVCKDSTEHSEESGSSSVPQLIPAPGKQPSTLMSRGDGSFSSDSNHSSSSAERIHHSEASTAAADEVYQSRLETSDEMLPPLNKKSSSSSLGKSKSDTSSSLYPASSSTSSLTSSLSSDASRQYYCHLDPVKADTDQKEEEICSQDLFADKEDSNAISSQEVSRISTPQDRSTPVENKQVKRHAQDLYRQVLRSTSTPVNSQEPITPPSHGEFNCLQFSGSSSGGSKREASHDLSIEAQLLEPSSPTANLTHTSIMYSESSSSRIVVPSSSSMQIDSTPEQQQSSGHDKQDHHILELGSEKYASSSTTDTDNIIGPSPDSFHCRADKVSSSPEMSEKLVHPDENSDNHDVGLPQWQKQIISKSKEKASTLCCTGKSSPSSSNNATDEIHHEHESWCKEWQSVQSSSNNESMTTTRKQPMTVKHVTFLMDDSKSQPEQCQSRHTTANNEESLDDSLSPSSFVIGDQQGLAKLVPPRNRDKSRSCSQPDLSDDLFNAVTESAQDEQDTSTKDNQDISGALYPYDGEEEIVESQFDLHLTQSQTDSQIPHEDGFLGHMQVLTSTEHDVDLLTTNLTTTVSSTEQIKSKETSSTSQVPLASRAVGHDCKDAQVTMPAKEDVTYKSITQHSARESTQSTSQHDTEPVMSNERCLKSNQEPLLTNSTAIQQPPMSSNTVQQYLLSSKNASKQTTTMNKNNIEQYLLSTNVIPKQTNPLDDIQQHITIQQPIPASTTPLNTNNPSSPTIPSQPSVQASSNQQPTISVAVPLLSSELSSESITSFHFSLPPTVGDVLVASTCTTPPPIPSWQPAEREASIETLSDSLPSNQPPQPSLTFSMPRQDTPDSQHDGIVLPFDQPSTSNLFDIPTTSQLTELSVFALARSRKNNQPKRHDKGKGPPSKPLDNRQKQAFPDERSADPDDYNPFQFSSQDSVACEPLIKRPRTNQTSQDNATKIPYTNPQQDIKKEPNSYINTTTTRTITTVTTEVKRIITFEIRKEGSDEVIERIVYEEEDKPFIEQKAHDDVSQEIIVETGKITYVRQPTPSLPALDEMPRVSPRRKSQDDNDKPPRKYRKRKNKNDVDSLKEKRRRRDDERQTKKKSSRREHKNDDDDDGKSSDNQTDNDKPIETPPSPLRLDCTVRLSKGTRVYARWVDGFYYPGMVFSIAIFQSEMFYEVMFDDGDRRKTKPCQVMACEMLPIGQVVMAQDPDGYYDPGIIVSQSEQGYEVMLDKTHERKNYLKKDVILSEDQMRILARVNNNSTTTSSTEPVVSSDAQTKFQHISATDTNSHNQQTTAQTADNNDETPKSTRKRRRRRGGARQSSVKKSSSDESAEARLPRKVPKRAQRNILKKPSLPTRSSPRKQDLQINNTGNNGQINNTANNGQINNTASSGQNNNTASSSDQITTNILPTNDSIFAGFAFLITRCYNISSDSESELQEFDRALVERQIEAGGGVILKDFSEVHNTVADQCFLISNTYCRTVKYFQCLANGIPMVSHMWIHDCTVLNALQDHNNYLLPAGLSLETEEVVECESRTNLPSGLNVYLQGDNHFKVTWSSVLTAAGVRVISKLPNRPSRAAQLDDDELCNVVIAQSPSLPQSLHHTCQSLGIPIVSLEWLFQCLINGYIVDYYGHPKYDYKYIADNNEDI